MNSKKENIIGMLCKKMMLYHELQACFDDEKQSLVSVDLDKLWEISKAKDRLCFQIMEMDETFAAESKVISGLSNGEPFPAIDPLPPEDKREIQRSLEALKTLENQIDMRRRENKAIIDDSISFLDEMITLLTDEAVNVTTYSGRRKMVRSSSAVLLSREI